LVSGTNLVFLKTLLSTKYSSKIFENSFRPNNELLNRYRFLTGKKPLGLSTGLKGKKFVFLEFRTVSKGGL
jgi:hypothetical protein